MTYTQYHHQMHNKWEAVYLLAEEYASGGTSPLCVKHSSQMRAYLLCGPSESPIITSTILSSHPFSAGGESVTASHLLIRKLSIATIESFPYLLDDVARIGVVEIRFRRLFAVRFATEFRRAAVVVHLFMP